MATTVAVLEAKLRADTREFNRDLDRSEGKMSKFGAVAKTGALAAGAGIAYGLGKVAKIGWDEFNEGQAVAAQTNAVLKSTGGVANVTAKQVDNLSTSLMRKSGIDDEQIKTGANMLLTFTRIRNEVGKDNDIFDQATKATLDLSVATGKDMRSASVLVGKALNDPIKGLTALTRVGVTFSDAQKEQIERMVEMGDTAGAQKVILRELRKEFGGSAEAAGKTFGGQINILRERFNNWAGDMVAKIIPILQRFGQWVMPLISKAAQFVGDVMESHVRPAIKAVADTIKRNEPQLRQLWADVTEIIQTMWKVAAPILRVLFTKVVPFVLGVAIKYVSAYIRVVASIIDTVRKVVNWFRNSFLPGVQRVWDAVREKVAAVSDFIRDRVRSRLEAVRNVFALVRNTAQFTWNFIRDKTMVVVGAVQRVIDKVQALINKFRDLFNKAKSWIPDIGGFFGGLGGAVGRARQAVGDFGSAGLGATSLVALGRQLQSMGFQVGEHPAFGGVSGGHVPGSYHYQGRALDINWPGGGSMEMSKLDWLNSRLRRMPGVKELLWRTAGHFDHLHVAMNRGGVVPGPRGAPVPVLAHGGETFIPTHRGGGAMVANVYLDGKLIAQGTFDHLRNAAASYRRTNGRSAF